MRIHINLLIQIIVSFSFIYLNLINLSQVLCVLSNNGIYIKTPDNIVLQNKKKRLVFKKKK